MTDKVVKKIDINMYEKMGVNVIEKAVERVIGNGWKHGHRLMAKSEMEKFPRRCEILGYLSQI